MKATNPVEAFNSYKSALDSAEDEVKIDDLPNKDWLRAT